MKKRGFNLIGDIKAETGLGQSMRILAGMLQRMEVPFCIIYSSAPGKLEHNDNSFDGLICAQPQYEINLIHVNPGEWAEFYGKMPDSLFAGRYNIAFWLWELETFPREWSPCTETVDEIWTPSEFISRSIRSITEKPVFTIPYEIAVSDGGKEYSIRERFKLPARKFLFLIMYDFKSVSERKNPAAAINAYKKAFPEEQNGVGLAIKVNHLEDTKQLELLKKRLNGYQNVYFITENMSRMEVESLIAEADVLVSLHRSEGFGLPMAEAMYAGTPVIATNWSANTEFMDEESSCLVDCALIKIEKTVGPYRKGSRWAEADIDKAAFYMQKLVYDGEYYEEIKKNGKQKIRITNNKAAQILRSRAAAVMNDTKR